MACAVSSFRARVLLLGPSRSAVSGVSTHLNQLFQSELPTLFDLSQFQVGREGRREGRFGTLLRLVASPFALWGCLISRRPQIVHINTSFDLKGYWRDVVYLAIAAGLRRKIVYQVHGGALPQELFPANRALNWLLRRVLSCPDAVVLLTGRELAAYRQFAPAARVSLIANAVDIPATDLSLGRYASGRPLEIVYVGRLAESKGVFDTVEAMKLLRERGVDTHFRLAGGGPAEGALRAAITAAGLADRIELLGAIFGAAKQKLWREANILAFPTAHPEGLPYALLEAMAAGAVPVVSPAGGIPEVMHDQVHGVLVPPHDPHALADALEGLHHDRVRLHRLALAGRQRIVDQYSVARLVAQFEQLYSSLI